MKSKPGRGRPKGRPDPVRKYVTCKLCRKPIKPEETQVGHLLQKHGITTTNVLYYFRPLSIEEVI